MNELVNDAVIVVFTLEFHLVKVTARGSRNVFVACKGLNKAILRNNILLQLYSWQTIKKTLEGRKCRKVSP